MGSFNALEPAQCQRTVEGESKMKVSHLLSSVQSIHIRYGGKGPIKRKPAERTGTWPVFGLEEDLLPYV